MVIIFLLLIQMNDLIKQFDIFLIDLNPTRGVEQKGLRPCVVLQSNAVNTVSKAFLIAPLTSQRLDRLYYCQVGIKKSSENGLNSDCKLKLEQVRVVDKIRFEKKLGSLEPLYHSYIFEAIDLIFDARGDFIE